MGKVKYDEFQLAKRHKIAYQTLIILLVMVGLNGYVKSNYGVWAEPYLESMVLIFVPGFYFAGRSIWQNAYIRANDRVGLYLFTTGLVAGVSLISLGSSISLGIFRLVEDGQLGGQIGMVMLCLMFTMIFVLLVVRRWVDRKVME